MEWVWSCDAKVGERKSNMTEKLPEQYLLAMFLRQFPPMQIQCQKDFGWICPPHPCFLDQALPRNWIIFRRSRFDGLPVGNSSNCFIAFRSSASFFRNSRLASVSK
jgi:hypothetical protein